MSSNSIKEYSLTWSDSLIHRVNATLRSLHQVLHEWYVKHDYPTVVPLPTLKGAAKHQQAQEEGGGGGGEEEDAAAAAELDVVSPAGSFHLRTTVHTTPYPEDHFASGIAVDLVLTMPEEVCSEKDIYEGHYLERRAAFMQEVKAWLEKVQVKSEAVVASSHAQQEGEKDEGDDDDDEEKESTTTPSSTLHRRLARMEVVEVPIHRCYGASEKSVLHIKFTRHHPLSPSLLPTPYESVYLILHIRPAVHTARATGHKVIRKHPLYSYLILEDYLMPVYLRRLHQFCVAYPSLRRAVVLLKCWAKHVGLHAPSSGHSEGLNGFIIAAMVLHLTEIGILTPGMSEEAAARTVLRQITSGYFRTPPAGQDSHSQHRLPVPEEKGEVCVLHLQRDSHNVLFRSTSQFFRMVVESAAAEALADASLPLIEYLQQLPFLPLRLRFDVHMEVNGYPSLSGPASGSDTSLHRSAEHYYFSPVVQRAHRIQAIARQAMVGKAEEVTVSATGPQSVGITIRLVSEAEGRNRLTRGPLIEDTVAVEAFNLFWGVERTSTRQFPDGSIHRCVLWEAVESTTATTTQVVLHAIQYALHRHWKDACGPTLGEEEEEDEESKKKNDKVVAPEITVQPFLSQLECFLYEQLGDGEEWRDAVPVTHKSLRTAWASLQKLVADLPKRSLPCIITNFDTISASERMTEAFPVRPSLALLNRSAVAGGSQSVPSGVSLTADIEPIYCVLTIDDKGKIPDTVEAVGVMKAAIGAQLSTILETTYGGGGAAAGGRKDNKKQSAAATSTESSTTTPSSSTAVLTSLCHPHGVDVVYHGYLFRIFVAHYREVSLMRALQMNAQADVLEQKLFWSVQHTHFLRSVSFGHSTFPMAVRLAKRWVSAMGLYEFVLPEVMELLVAHAYLHEKAAPLNAITGFFRFLEILATHDWKHQPLVLPSTDSSSVNTPATAAGVGHYHRDEQEGGMAIHTPYAPLESPFTRATPRPMVLHRLVALANQALGLMLQSIRLQGGDMVERRLFTTDSSVFDATIQLNGLKEGGAASRLLLHPDRVLQPTPHSLTSAAAAPQTIRRIWQWDELQPEERRAYIRPRIEYNPAAQLVRVIRGALRDKAMVFYDTLAPTVLHLIALTPSPPRNVGVVKALAQLACEASRGVIQMSMVSFSSAVTDAVPSSSSTTSTVVGRSRQRSSSHGSERSRMQQQQKKGGREVEVAGDDTRKRKRSSTVSEEKKKGAACSHGCSHHQQEEHAPLLQKKMKKDKSVVEGEKKQKKKTG